MSARARRRIAIAAVGFICAWGCNACQHRPTIAYPKSVEAGPTEATFDCPRLDDAILKADAVRWVMRQDGARLLSPYEEDSRVAGDLALTVASLLTCFFCPPMPVLGDDGHALVDGVDRRLLSLLKLKADQGCPAVPTDFPSMDDLQLYAAVSTLVAEEVREGSNVRQIRAERLRLLDGLRPAP